MNVAGSPETMDSRDFLSKFRSCDRCARTGEIVEWFHPRTIGNCVTRDISWYTFFLVLHPAFMSPIQRYFPTDRLTLDVRFSSTKSQTCHLYVGRERVFFFFFFCIQKRRVFLNESCTLLLNIFQIGDPVRSVRPL